MSYQQDLRQLLASLARKHSYPATFDVSVARSGSFEMKVVRQGEPPNPEKIFDLSGGLTPRVQKLVAEWFISTLPVETAAP
jgi:hypothetical protein